MSIESDPVVSQFMESFKAHAKTHLQYEDDLPDDISQSEYDEWYKHSLIIDGVRMGIPLKRNESNQ